MYGNTQTDYTYCNGHSQFTSKQKNNTDYMSPSLLAVSEE